MTAVSLMMMLGGATAAMYLWHWGRARRLASERLGSMIGPAAAADTKETLPFKSVRSFPPRYRLAPPAVGAAAMAMIWVVTRLPWARELGGTKRQRTLLTAALTVVLMSVLAWLLFVLPAYWD